MNNEEKLVYAQEKEKIGERIDLPELITRLVDIANANKPFYMLRLGDCTVRILRGDPLKMTDPFAHPGGNFCDKESAEYLVNGMREAIDNVDMCGIFKNDADIFMGIESSGVKIPLVRFHAFNNLLFACDKRFVDAILRTKKLLIINNRAAQYKKILDETLPESNSIVFPGDAALKNKSDCEKVLEFVRTADYEVAIVSMGMWADKILHEVKKAGKIGIDYGHALDHHIIGQYPINAEYDNMADYCNVYHGKKLANGENVIPANLGSQYRI